MPRPKETARQPVKRSKRGREAGPEHTVLEAQLVETGEAGEEAGGEEAAASKARRVHFDGPTGGTGGIGGGGPTECGSGMSK